MAEQGEKIESGDRIVIVGPADAATDATSFLGRRAHTHLAHDHEAVDYRRVVLSRPKLSGSSVAELDIAGRTATS